MYDYLINGSGFKAFYFALRLRSLNKKNSIAINFSNNLGGIYNSPKLKKYYLDLGCHLFDYTDLNFKKIFEVNEKNIVKIPLKYASINNNKITNNYSIYDYRNINFIDSIRKELNVKVNLKNSFENLREYFIYKFGSLATIPINNFSIKMTGHTLEQINYLSNEVFFSDRILIYNNSKALKLKKEGYENLLAANTKSIHDYSKKFIVFAYKNGNYGFYKNILKLLKKNNIIALSDKKIKGRKVFETNVPKTIQDKYLIKVPMHLVYIEVPSYEYTYFHDYSDNPIFRVSSPGFYTNQIYNKKSYLCVEIPDPFNIYDKKIIENLIYEYFKTNKNLSILNFI